MQKMTYVDRFGGLACQSDSDGTAAEIPPCTTTAGVAGRADAPDVGPLGPPRCAI